jgi:hypothetical protein
MSKMKEIGQKNGKKEDHKAHHTLTPKPYTPWIIQDMRTCIWMAAHLWNVIGLGGARY